jgi:hypothetical protein
MHGHMNIKNMELYYDAGTYEYQNMELYYDARTYEYQKYGIILKCMHI